MADTVWDRICEMERIWHGMAIIDFVLLLLLGFSFLYVEPGSGNFVVAVLALIVIGVYMAAYAVVWTKCAGREENK